MVFWSFLVSILLLTASLVITIVANVKIRRLAVSSLQEVERNAMDSVQDAERESERWRRKWESLFSAVERLEGHKKQWQELYHTCMDANAAGQHFLVSRMCSLREQNMKLQSELNEERKRRGADPINVVPDKEADISIEYKDSMSSMADAIEKEQDGFSLVEFAKKEKEKEKEQ